MSSIGAMIFILMPLLAVFLVIPMGIGVYVWRDARRRGMNAVLWTVIAVVAPSLIGFIIYLLVRGNHPDMTCARCGERVTEEFVVCPKCGAKLRLACESCGFPVEADWSVCPRCAAPLSGQKDDRVPPVRHVDRALRRILVLIIAVPVLLMLVFVFSFSAYSGTAGSSAGMAEMSVEDYFEEQAAPEAKEEVQAWLDGLEQGEGQAYALCHSRYGETENEYVYLVYAPGMGNSVNQGLGVSNGLFGSVLGVDLERTGDAGSLLFIFYNAKERPKLKIKVDGKKIPCEVTEVDFELSGM